MNKVFKAKQGLLFSSFIGITALVLSAGLFQVLAGGGPLDIISTVIPLISKPVVQDASSASLGELGGQQSLAQVKFISSATTTPLFMSPQALSSLNATSSPYTIDISGADSLHINWQLNASSTASSLGWQQQYSYDGVDYYDEDYATTSGLWTTHNATASSTLWTMYHQWTPGGVGISRKTTFVNNLGYNYMRLTLFSWGATSSVWGEVILNKEL